MPLNNKLEMIITAREKDLVSFTVRRILPYASHRMVGPFIFFDHMGPATFPPSKGMDVRPHPHINLATVTYLFAGKIWHRDSLGSDQMIEPGAVNWMTAGKGIVHSERTPPEERAKECKLHGIQLWVALPEEHEEDPPTFSHHPKETLPEFEVESCSVKLLLGNLFGKTSPVPVHSDLFYAEVKIPSGQKFNLDVSGREAAVYVVNGNLQIEGELVHKNEMAVAKAGENLQLTAKDDVHIMVLGGRPVGERFIFWNFVSSSKERLEDAKKEWALGPLNWHSRFSIIPGDNGEFIPLPEESSNPKGTIM